MTVSISSASYALSTSVSSTSYALSNSVGLPCTIQCVIIVHPFLYLEIAEHLGESDRIPGMLRTRAQWAVESCETKKCNESAESWLYLETTKHLGERDRAHIYYVPEPHGLSNQTRNLQETWQPGRDLQGPESPGNTSVWCPPNRAERPDPPRLR